MYEKNGYWVIPDFATLAECEEMRTRANLLVDNFDPSSVPRSVFTTEADRHISNAYFMASADKIHFFFEESGYAINKIGHALHDLDDVFRTFSYSPRVRDIALSLGYQKPVLAQSMYIFKQPGVGGKVNPHQDSTFLYTEPMSCCGIWLALEDATRDNGCLWAIPGSHRYNLRSRFARDDVTGKMHFEQRDTSQVWDDNLFVPLEAKVGTAIVLHGQLVHKSEQNHSPVSRHAYSLHFIEGADTHVYPKDNWLQRADGFASLPTLSSSGVINVSSAF